MTPPPTKEIVTTGKCDQRHTRVNTFFTILLGLIGLLITVGAASAWSGFEAQRKMEVHESRQVEQIRHINQGLERNEAALRRIEEILRDGKDR
jgi:hypothetical protein